MAMLEWSHHELSELSQSISLLPERVKYCACCGGYSEDATCDICENSHRDPALICVLEHPRQIPGFERTGRYRGTYHILGGRLSPLDGVDANQLRIAELIDRLENVQNAEIIIATSADVEGEATAAYLARRISQQFPETTVSRIAQGVPVGADLSYTDAATLSMAIESRRNMGR